MKLSQLHSSCGNFEQASFTIELEKNKIFPSEGFHLKQLHIETSMDMMANFCEIEINHVKANNMLMSALATGTSITIKGGYQEDESIIFQGYIQTICVTCIEEEFLEKVHVYAQDVKGLMMLCKSAQITTGKKKSAILQEILQASLYKKYISNVSIEPIPEALDSFLYRDGNSDYDVVEQICRDCFCACYVAKDTLYFKERHTIDSSSLILDEWKGIDYIEVETSMENQIGSICVSTCDGFDSKKEAKETYAIAQMPFSTAMSDILSGTTATIVDNSFDSVDEVKAIATGFVKEAKHSYGKLRGKGVFLKEYLVGSGIEVSKFQDKKSKHGYLSKVEHIVDDEGARTQWEAILTKG